MKIISASRRTDIPGHIEMTKKAFNTSGDFFVFWTKNPCSYFIDNLDSLNKDFYIQFTLTPYTEKLEPVLGKQKHKVAQKFIALSKKYGSERMVWRFDPIIITDNISKEALIEAFRQMCGHIADYTDIVIISFLDMYGKIKNSINKYKIHTLTHQEMVEIAKEMKAISMQHGLMIETCAEDVGLPASKCIDDRRIQQITGKKVSLSKDPSQRKQCGCIKSTDIGNYHTCSYNCVYCYAN